MMKYLIHIWLIMMVLANIFAGCNRATNNDKRLVEADRIIYDNPEQAKAMLLEINPKDLNEADDAYYNLLLTQASYICYDVFTNATDSMINRALRYYEQHRGNKERFARANIYKGTVLQEFKQLDSAMFYYKRAELYADEDDHFNRGYAQLRMGSLYTSYKAYDGRDLEKYEDAVASFRKTDNRHYLIISLRDLGALYRFRKVNEAEQTLNEAIELSHNEQDTDNYIQCISHLAYLYFMQDDNGKAYKQLQRIKALKLYDLDINIYRTFACVYANIGKPDSALWFMNLATQQFNNDSLFHKTSDYLVPMSQIAKDEGNMLEYYRLSHENDSIDNAIRRNQDIVKIMYSELDCAQQFQKEQDNHRRNRYYIMAGFMLLMLLLALMFYRRAHRYDKLVLELKDQFSSQMNDLTSMQQNISEMQINDERLKSFISSHMEMMREVIDACYHEPNNRIAENMKRIIKFQDSNRDNWVKLYDYIDLEHNNIMTRTREQYPQLNDKDLLLLALTCMGYSYIQTAIIMGYSNATSVSVLKQRLAKKMGLECTLNEYIEQNSNVKNE
jgi:hypothetical protein